MCDWRHNIGLTAIVVIMSLLQCASGNDEVKEMADLLLKDSSFLYDDLNSSSSKKAFRSNIICQLLNSAHLQYMASAMSQVHAICHTLFNFCGVIALCGAVV